MKTIKIIIAFLLSMVAGGLIGGLSSHILYDHIGYWTFLLIFIICIPLGYLFGKWMSHVGNK